MYGVDDGETFWLHTEPGAAAAMVEWLQKMVFMSRVEIADVTDDYAIVWRPGPAPADGHADPQRCGFARRARGVPAAGRAGRAPRARRPGSGRTRRSGSRRATPRFGLDTDERAIPNEVGWLGVGVHLDKGCYRGQETVARVHNLGRPPRRLVRLHLDGSVDHLPAHGYAVRAGDKQVGFIGSAARHHELRADRARAGEAERWTPTSCWRSSPRTSRRSPRPRRLLVDPEVGLHVARPGCEPDHLAILRFATWRTVQP